MHLSKTIMLQASRKAMFGFNASMCEAGCFAKAPRSISMLQMHQLAQPEGLEDCAGPPFDASCKGPRRSRSPVGALAESDSMCRCLTLDQALIIQAVTFTIRVDYKTHPCQVLLHLTLSSSQSHVMSHFVASLPRLIRMNGTYRCVCSY